MFQTVDHKIQVFLSLICPEKPCFIISGKICAFKYMTKLELDALDIHLIQIGNSFQDIIRTFAWKT